MGRTKHKFMSVTHGWWWYWARCSCGWKSVPRWKPETAEADLMVHQYREHRDHVYPPEKEDGDGG